MSGSDADTDAESVENAERAGDADDALPADFTDEQLDALADAVKKRLVDDAAKAAGGDSEDSEFTFTEATEQVVESLDVVKERFDVMNDRIELLEDHIASDDTGTDAVDDSTDTQPTSDQFRGFQ
ncbi:hypothetical protein [Halorubrum sp. LN27]|uniref:hypothetical protein n=1 Tax=Halorubrum sp. LN27 TaxID=2801032 RepID=UPI00190CDC53|nr:hypothetical protein [Halorubrum sp. LN27]